MLAAGLTLAAHAAGEVPPASFADPGRRAALMQALPQIELMMAERAKDLGTPGMAYAVVIDGDVVLQRGIGLRDAAAKAPVEADTAFRIASMSKSFTAMAVLKLRDAGRLSLDDPVAKHVPELRDWPPATADSGPITIRQLLAHTAGLPEDNPQGDRTLAITPEQLSALLRGGVPLASANGSAFEYSNLGFVILGRVVTQVSGRRYQDFIADEILQPLGMTRTAHDPLRVPAAKRAQGHRRDGEAFVDEPLLADGEAGAMGGLLSTAGDMGRFIAAMLDAWPPRDERERGPLPRRTLREMQVGLGWPELITGRRIPGGRVTGIAGSYGEGLFVSQDCRYGRVVDHGGGLPGFGSFMLWLPDHGVGVVVLANGTYASAGTPAYEAIAMLHATGALKVRQAQPAPLLKQAALQAAALIDDWSDERAAALAAENLFLDEPLAKRRETLKALRAPLGACKPGRLLAENALRGKQRLDCEKGFVEIELSLAPTQPPRVQHLAATASQPLEPAAQQAITEMSAAIAGGAHALLLAPAANRALIGAVLESIRSAYGSCRAGEVLEGDGRTKATVQLQCDRGRVTAVVALSEGRLASVSTRRSDALACVP